MVPVNLIEVLNLIKCTYHPISGDSSPLLVNVNRMLTEPYVTANAGIPGNIKRISTMLLAEYWGRPDPKECERAIVSVLGRDKALVLAKHQSLPENFSPSELGAAVHKALFAELDRIAYALGRGPIEI